MARLKHLHVELFLHEKKMQLIHFNKGDKLKKNPIVFKIGLQKITIKNKNKSGFGCCLTRPVVAEKCLWKF